MLLSNLCRKPLLHALCAYLYPSEDYGQPNRVTKKREEILGIDGKGPWYLSHSRLRVFDIRYSIIDSRQPSTHLFPPKKLLICPFQPVPENDKTVDRSISKKYGTSISPLHACIPPGRESPSHAVQDLSEQVRGEVVGAPELLHLRRLERALLLHLTEKQTANDDIAREHKTTSSSGVLCPPGS